MKSVKSKDSPHSQLLLIEEELLNIDKIFLKCFLQKRTKETASAYFQGLISSIERKNSWQIAEQAGFKDPYSFQYLLGRAVWDEEKLRDLSRDYTLEYLSEENDVISVDETGFLKKGQKSAGVSRQYTGTAGRIENSQVGVFLSYSTSKGRALIDRELYIPQEWFKDEKRRSDAGIPESIKFKTKPQLALEMLKRTFENIRPSKWVVGDEVYSCSMLRIWLENERQQYALSTACNTHVSIGFTQIQVREVLNNILAEEWKTISAGNGTKGQRIYKWCRRKVNSDAPDGWSRWVVFRKNVKDENEIAFYIVFARDDTDLNAIAKAIGSRWTIEECFEMAKGEVGLDQYEIRSWIGWYRHITISMLALSFLTKLREQLNQNEIEENKKKYFRKRKNRMKVFLTSRGLI